MSEDGQVETAVLAEVTDAVVSAWTRAHGRGPTRAKSYLLDDLLVTVMYDTMTPMERTLVDKGRPDAVRNVRNTFEEVLAEEYREIVESLTGRRVVDYFSQMLVHVPVTIELFQLDGARAT